MVWHRKGESPRTSPFFNPYFSVEKYRGCAGARVRRWLHIGFWLDEDAPYGFTPPMGVFRAQQRVYPTNQNLVVSGVISNVWVDGILPNLQGSGSVDSCEVFGSIVPNPKQTLFPFKNSLRVGKSCRDVMLRWTSMRCSTRRLKPGPWMPVS